MKNPLIILTSICLILLFSSCGDDSCVQQDWIGTWELEGNNKCEAGSSSITASDEFEFEAGSTSDKIEAGGQELQLLEENCSITVDEVILTLDGDKLTSDFGEGCVFTYSKK